MSDYGIAQICLNGHLKSSKCNDTDIKEKFCSICGQGIINTCEKCSTPIKGSYRQESHIDPPFLYSNALYQRPSYCYNCGESFPWTKISKESAYELIELADSLDESEKADFKTSINYLILDTPKTTTAIIKFQRCAKKAGTEITKGLSAILVDLVSETVKKSIWS